MFVLAGGSCVAKIIRLFVEGKSPPLAADVDRGQHTAAAREHSLATQALLLCFCAGGLLTSYLIWGLLQERIMAYHYTGTGSTTERFTNSQFLVFMNRIFALCVAATAIAMQRRHSAHQPPLYKYSYSSFSNIISSWCQYEALKFVSFPVQVSVHSTTHCDHSLHLHSSVELLCILPYNYLTRREGHIRKHNNLTPLGDVSHYVDAVGIVLGADTMPIKQNTTAGLCIDVCKAMHPEKNEWMPQQNPTHHGQMYNNNHHIN